MSAIVTPELQPIATRPPRDAPGLAAPLGHVTNGNAAVSTQIAIAAATIGVLVLPAIPAHAESGSVTVNQLEARGLDVTRDRVGSAPLNRRDRDRFIPVVVSRTITVSVDRSRP